MTEPDTQHIADILKAFAAEIMRHSIDDMLRLMRRAELSMPQVVALMYLRHASAASISDISDHLNLSLAATSHLVERLVLAGFVTRTEDPTDRRLKHVTLTAAGRTLVEEVKQARVEELSRRLAQLPPPLLNTLLDAMASVVVHIRAADAPTDPPNRAC